MARNKHIFPFGYLTRNKGRVAVYRIVTPEGGVYVGRSRDVFKRLRDHALSRNPNEKLNLSILKHGWHNHSYEILHELPIDISDKVLDDYEEIYLEQYRETGHMILNEYSARQGVGRKISTCVKEKMRRLKKGSKQLPEHIEKRRLSNIGKHNRKVSEETKKKISEKLKGVKYTPERLEALRKNKKSVSEETRGELSERAKQQWLKQKGGSV